MSKKKIGGLGRGLGALIPGMEKPVKATAKEKKAEPEKTREVIKEVIVKESDGKPIEIAIDAIKVNPNQPRTEFDQNSLQDLCSSVKEYGVLQPILVRKTVKGYELIAGERRYKSAQMAGLQTVPAVIANVDDETSAEVALVENVQRRDLTAIEEARSYKSLLDKGYLTQEQLAKRMGLSQPSIANKLRLLNLDDEVQQALLDEKISERVKFNILKILNEKYGIVEKDLIDHWANSTAKTINMAAFNFAMAFAMDNATIEYPSAVDLRKINFKKLFGIENLRKHELAIRLEHPIDVKTQIKDFIEWSRP